jgi:glycosyltransferase involved in cell wall biosynthesis
MNDSLQRVEPITQRRIAILFFETYLGCAPSLISAARALTEHGYLVDIYLRAATDRFVKAPALGDHVNIITVGKQIQPKTLEEEIEESSAAAQKYQWFKSRLSPAARERLSIALQWTKRSLRAIGPALINEHRRFVEEIKKTASPEQYVAVIGVDTHGVVAADSFMQGTSVPVFFWSLEITFLRDSLLPPVRWLKRKERKAHQRAHALIIQDQERADALCKENDAASVPIVYVPNSPRGYMAPDLDRTYLYDKLNLPKECRIVLHAGSVCDGMQSPQLASAAAQWPPDTRLVFHSHSQLNPDGRYLQQLVATGNGRVVLSTDPVDYDDLDRLIVSSTIGIVSYDNSLGPNFQLLAGASGKLAHYLRCGIPVICVDNQSITRVLDRWQCGIGVSDARDTTTAIQRILADYEGFQERARKCYEEAYEFDKHFESVLSVLNRIQTNTATNR